MPQFEEITTPHYGYNVLYDGSTYYVWNRRINKFIAINEMTGDIDIYSRTDVYKFFDTRLAIGGELYGTNDKVCFTAII